MADLLSNLDKFFLGNSLTRWVIACGSALFIITATTLIRRSVRQHYERMRATERLEVLEVPLHIASRTSTLFLLALGLFVGLQSLYLPNKVIHAVQAIFTVVVFWQFGVWSTTAALAWIENKRRGSLPQDRASVSTLGIIAVLVRAFIWSIILLLVLDNLDVKITTLVAGLGIGGVAVALAVQNVLGDLFASLSIVLDKPFIVGDFMAVGDFMGAVEYIGIKSTRLRSLSGEQIVISNADLLGSRIRNYGRMTERRVVFGINVTYETPRAKLAQIPAKIRAIIEAQQPIRFDRCHLAKLGNSAIEYEAVYYVTTADYNQFMDIQQTINLRICEFFEQEQIEFAYPTQKLWLQRTDISRESQATVKGT